MFRRKRKANDFSAEIEAHIQLESERLREQGLSEGEALAAARRAFGNVTRAEERFYESRRWLWWDHLRQDVRFGLRMLRKSPGFTAVAVLILALGIGATIAIFSVIYALALRKLPVERPEELVELDRGRLGQQRALVRGVESLSGSAEYFFERSRLQLLRRPFRNRGLKRTGGGIWGLCFWRLLLNAWRLSRFG